MIDASTPSISPTAKKNSAMTDRPSMRSPCRAIQALPAKRRIRAATIAAPASSASSFAPSVIGEIAMAGPTNSVANTGAVKGVSGGADDQCRERERCIEPHQRREGRRGNDRRRGSLQDHRDVEARQPLVDAEREERQPDQQRRRQHHPGRGRADNQRA